jgi:site-specific DNA-methyltransferase (adenine-specific)
MDVKELENRIINADCMDILKQLPGKCIDLVCTDCPYHVGHNGGGGRCQKKWMTAGQMENYENTKSGKMFEHNDISFEDWLPEIYRVLKDDTHCYIMINGLNLSELQKQAEKVGFIYQNILVWEKNNATPNKFYMQKLEFILMLRKGKERWINNMGQKNIIKVPNNVGNKVHPTEKPVSLMEVLIENSTNKGELVLDPFAGTGTTLKAAISLGRKAIGYELNPEYIKKIE